MKKLIRVLLAPPDEDVVHVDDANLKAGVVAFSKDKSEMYHVVETSSVKKNNFNDNFIVPMCDTLAELIKEDTDYDYYQLNGLEKPKRIVLNKQDVGEWLLLRNTNPDNNRTGPWFLIDNGLTTWTDKSLTSIRANIERGAEVYLITEA